MSRKIIYGYGISQEQREINNKIYNELYPMFKYAKNNDYSNEDLSKYVVFSGLGYGYANHSYRIHSKSHQYDE